MRASSALLLLLAAGCVDPGGSAQGVVLFGGAGAGDVDVTLAGPVTRATRTNASGEWSATLPPGTYAVTAAAANTSEGAVSTTVAVSIGHRATAETLRLTPVGRVVGSVILPEADPAQVQVLVIGGAGAARASSTGEFAVEGVPAGSRDLLLWAPGFVQQRVLGVDVRRGETTDVGAHTLTRLDTSGAVPTVGALRGSVRVPGSDDSGVLVTVEGTSKSTTTDATGNFFLPDVPTGIVVLTFTKGENWARLPRVLVAPGSEGFVIDGGLYELARTPVPLGRSVRLDDLQWYPVVVSPRAEWVALTTSYRTGLMNADGGVHTISTLNAVGLAGYYHPSAFHSSDAGLEYWHAEQDLAQSQVVLVRTSLPSLTSAVFASVPYLNQTVFLPCGDGAAWSYQGSLFIRSDATSRAREVLAGTLVSTTSEPSVVVLPDETILAIERGQLDHFALDGTLLDVVPLSSGSQGLTISTDGHYALVGNVGPAAPTLVDRTTAAAQVLTGCSTWTGLSPDGELLDCYDSIREVRSGAVTPIGPHSDLRWLPGKRVGVVVNNAATPELHVLGVGQTPIVVTGLSWYATQYFMARDSTHLRLLAEFDPSTGLGRAIDVRLSDGQRTVIADGVAPDMFVSFDTGVLVARPRTIGTDLDMVFVPATTGEPEVMIGRWFTGLWLPTIDPGGTRVSLDRFLPGRAYEWITFDSVTRAVVPQASLAAHATWIDEHRLLGPWSGAVPFTSSSGLYLTVVP